MVKTLSRIGSIDVFRALTMLLMIFVNDLWSLKDIPEWLEHTAADVDGLGLADVVFPTFLFIVGLSIPFAISNRRKKGQSLKQVSIHILTRSLALIIMGVYMVNLESYNTELAIINRYWWQILMTLAFFLIWNVYPRTNEKKRYLYIALQITGYLILILLAAIYKGGTIENPVWIKPYWWGILGLIGWAYLISAFVYLFAGSNLILLISALVFFNLFNVADFAGWLEFLTPIKKYIWIVGSGSMPAFTMGGVVASVIYIKLSKENNLKQFLIAMAVLGAIMLIFGLVTRPMWGISKIRATPAWVGICTGISFLLFGLLYVIVDVWKKRNWFSIIDAAGTSTLTCYLIPYYWYAITALLGFSLPIALRTGGIGILKSILFALIIVQITGVLEKMKIKLRI